MPHRDPSHRVAYQRTIQAERTRALPFYRAFLYWCSIRNQRSHRAEAASLFGALCRMGSLELARLQELGITKPKWPARAEERMLSRKAETPKGV